MDDAIQILIIEDHLLLREGIVSILDHEPGFKVVGQGSSAEEAIRLAHQLQPDLILLDMDLPVNGIAIAHAINIHSPETRFIFLTVSERDDRSIKPVSNSGRAYIFRNIGSTDLFRILRTAYAGKNVAPAFAEAADLVETSKTDSFQAESDPFLLTEIEEKILENLAAGLNYRRIGQVLNLSRGTVTKFARRILYKLDFQGQILKTIRSSQTREFWNRTYLAIEIGRK